MAFVRSFVSSIWICLICAAQAHAQDLFTPAATGTEGSTPAAGAHNFGDDRLYSQMNKVASWMEQYCKLNHRAPEQGEETADALRQMNQLIPNPAYNAQSIRLTPGLDADPQYIQPLDAPLTVMPDDGSGITLNRVTLTFDGSLSDLEIQEWRDNPPYEWQAAPGTIAVITNNQSLFLVWGADSTGLPLRDPASHRVVMIIGRYAMLYDTQE